MFFMMGLMPGRKEYEYNKLVICDQCGSYGRYHVFMTYMCLSIFFIPCFKWNKEYYVQTSCCNTLYRLDPEIGKAVAKGESVEILQEHLTRVRTGSRVRYRKCRSCGYETEEDFDFCPKCGQRF